LERETGSVKSGPGKLKSAPGILSPSPRIQITREFIGIEILEKPRRISEKCKKNPAGLPVFKKDF